MEIDKEEIKELAVLYDSCLKAARDVIDPLVLGEAEDFALTREDLRQIASSLFIQYNQNRRKSKGGGQKYTGPSTEAQQKHIASMAMTNPNKCEPVIQKFLDDNGKKSAEELSKSEASTLIDLLHAANPKR